MRIRSRFPATLLALGLFAGSLEAQQASKARIIAATDSLAKAAMASAPFAGLAVAVARGPEIILAKGYGLANVEHGVPVTPNTVFRLGSITKQFTAAAIARLAQEGKLSFDDTLTKYVPGYPTHGHRITINHLLNHTSGIRNFTATYGERRRLDLTHDQLLATFRAEPMDFATGTKYSYSNSGYYLLGMIIEKVSGQSYGDYLQSTFFGPLGMNGSSYCHNDPIIPNRSQGYGVKNGKLVNSEIISMSPPGAAGALCSTVGDLITWTRALHAGKVLSPEYYTKLITPGKLNDGSAIGYAYGLQIGAMENHPTIAHGGGISGFNTSLAYYNKDDLIVVVLNNTAPAPSIAQNVARAALQLPTVAARPRPTS